MKQVYFSHSYRDVSINAYFLDYFVDRDISLCADQKSDTWCVAKLERYLRKSAGFVSIIPRRAAADGNLPYSPYIAHELTLARRCRVPRLLFVDDVVLAQHRDAFPRDAVPFVLDQPKRDAAAHRDALERFQVEVSGGAFVPPQPSNERQATVVVAGSGVLGKAAKEVEDALQAHGFQPRMRSGKDLAGVFDDVRILEELLDSELCVFILGERLGNASLAMAMAHAHGIPSLRLRHDRRSKNAEPDITGLVRWATVQDLLGELSKQLDSYRKGLVLPVDMAKSTSTTDAARAVGTMEWNAEERHLWDLSDGGALVGHVFPDEPFVTDEASRVTRLLGTGLGPASGREARMKICRALYDGIKRHSWMYEFERKSDVPGRQAIRTPDFIATHRCATCLDLACLFASVLEAMQQDPIIVVLERKGSGHALAGYRSSSDEPLPLTSGLGVLRRNVKLGDVVLFDPTGAVAAEAPVGAETREERQGGGGMLAFADAAMAAEALVMDGDVRLSFTVDVTALRGRAS